MPSDPDPPVLQSLGFCGRPSPTGGSCYLDHDHDGPHYAPCLEHGDVECGHAEEWR